MVGNAMSDSDTVGIGPLFDEPWVYLEPRDGQSMRYRGRGDELEVYHDDMGWEPLEHPAVRALIGAEIRKATGGEA